MKYSESGDKVTLEMSRGDFSVLLFLLGAATGGLYKQAGENGLFWSAIEFVNALNAENPNFTRYEVPKGEG
jgi:hypothetical protein